MHPRTVSEQHGSRPCVFRAAPASFSLSVLFLNLSHSPLPPDQELLGIGEQGCSCRVCLDMQTGVIFKLLLLNVSFFFRISTTGLQYKITDAEET